MKTFVAILTIVCFSITLVQPLYAQQDADIETILKDGKETYLHGEYNNANEASAIQEINLEESDLPKTGLIEKPGIKKKKKFPWLIVIGSALALGVIIYFLFLKKSKFTLEAEVGEGVTGSPATGSASYNKNETVTYNYVAQEGYTNLKVKLNGNEVNASGIIKMDKNYKIEATAVGDLGPQNTLLVIKENGVDGDPGTGSYTYEPGSIVNYNYKLMNGFKNLLVKLDGSTVSNSGTITMDAGHYLHASAVPISGQTILTVSRGSGINGSPASGTFTYQVGDTVNYSYTLKSGYNDLKVKLDGKTVSASGTIVMDRDHSLNATASGGSNQYVLTVDKGTGVSGTPNSGSTSYSQGATVNYSYSLESGYANLVVKLDGSNVSASGTITMNASHNLTASATSALGEIHVSSTPSKAAIWLDGQDTGFLTTKVLHNIPAGVHTITLKLTGYKDATGQVTVIAGQTVYFHRDLQQL